MDLAKHVRRQEAHEIVYKACVAAVDDNLSLQQSLENVPEVVKHLTSSEVEKPCDRTRYMGCCQLMVDELLERGGFVFSKNGGSVNYDY